MRDTFFQKLHEICGVCGHCGKRKCAHKSTHSVLPSTISLDDIFTAFEQMDLSLNLTYSKVIPEYEPHLDEHGEKSRAPFSVHPASNMICSEVQDPHSWNTSNSDTLILEITDAEIDSIFSAITAAWAGNYTNKEEYSKRVEIIKELKRRAKLENPKTNSARFCYNRATKKIEKLVHGICIESFDPPEELHE